MEPNDRDSTRVYSYITTVLGGICKGCVCFLAGFVFCGVSVEGGDLRLTSSSAGCLVVAETLDPKVVLHVLILGVVTLSAGGQLG